VKLIVGLGNPGARYAGTPHNVGFEVVDQFARRMGIGMAAEKFHAWFGKGEVHTHPVVLLKPTTFMNRSGEAVLAAGRFYKLELADLLVIVDDIALPLGRLRLRGSGSSGLHKGLQDIIDRLGTQEWSRLRVGVGPAVGDPAAYVTGPFDTRDEPDVQRARNRAADAVECWIQFGLEVTMNRFNADDPDAASMKNGCSEN
jgi:PTH1 family peptidyl-tRNA hydrolase